MERHNILLIILPVLLFLFKNFFPIICERVFSDHGFRGVWAKTVEDLLQFPVDLLFIAISYTVPKIVDTIYMLSSFGTDTSVSVDEFVLQNSECTQNLLNYSVRCFVMLILLPVFVLLTKYAIKLGDEKKRWKQGGLACCLYLVSIAFVIYSLFLYQ